MKSDHDAIKYELFGFVWNNKKDQIKRESIYQDYDKSGIRMTDVNVMIKALRLAWIPRLLNTDSHTKIQLAENIAIVLQKIKAKDFYWLLNKKVNY